jgi:signal peptidase
MTNENKMPPSANKKDRVMTIIGIVLCVILCPILIVNCTLIVKSYINQDEVPTFGGYCPLIVLTDSMLPSIKSGDLIICQSIDSKEVKVGDVISFFDPEGNGTSVVTHQVIEILEDGSFRTQGTNNNTADTLPVPPENLVGIYRMRLAGAGNVALFLQSTPGLIVCIGLPVVLLVGYDFLRRRKYEKAKQQDTDALLAELQALRTQKAQEEAKSENESDPK